MTSSDGEQHQGICMTSISNPEVAAVFADYPPHIRQKILKLRMLILGTAAATEGVGALEEALKWGEPAYLTSQTRSGSTIRIDWKRSTPTEYAIYFHCRPNLVTTFRTLFPDDFTFDGNRSLVFNEDEPVPVKQLSVCIAMALTSHLSKPR